jgi:putative aminopeptidase FrvX
LDEKETMMKLETTLKEFMLLPAPSGYEKEMAYAMKKELSAYSGSVSIDRTGNVIAKFEGTDKNAPAVMVYAHMDQLGFIVRKIEDDGYLQVDRLGGIPEKVLPGLSLLIRSEDGAFHPGVIGMKSHHAMPPEEKLKVDLITSLSIDIGAKSSEEVRSKGIEVGCPAVYAPSFQKLMNDRICGTSLDNRGGCACLVYIASKLKNLSIKPDVYLVGTVWEEFNLRGAMMAARAINPEIAICLDVVLSGDTPDLKTKYNTALGNGAALTLYTFHGRGTLNGTLAHEGLRNLALSAAKEDSIPLQRFASLGILTDSSYLQFENKGIASVELGYPARYTHTPVETADLNDIRNLGDLVSGMLKRIDSNFNINRY